MKIQLPDGYSLVMAGLIVVISAMWSGGGAAIAQEKVEKASLKNNGEVSEWQKLSPQDQKKLREALREVWTDPQVISARENVNRSAQEYQEAIRETIASKDPDTAKLLERIQKSRSALPYGERRNGGAVKRYHSFLNGARSLELMLTPPGMMEKLSEQQRARFGNLSKQAREKPEVVQALRELKRIHEEDESIRKRKFEAIQKFRRLYFEALVELEPGLKEFIPPPRSGPPLPFGAKSAKGKGKGSPGKKRTRGPDGKSRDTPEKNSKRPGINREQQEVENGESQRGESVPQ